MIKVIYIIGIIIASGTVSPITAQQTAFQSSSDSSAVFQQWVKSLPDSVKSSVPADSLKFIFSNCRINQSNMPVFEPDTELTESMPQIHPPKVDEKMILPQFRKCPGPKWIPQKKRDG